MKALAVIMLTTITFRQVIRAMLIKRDKELDKLAYILFPTITIWMMALGVI